ncbi:hypothetical protein DFH06DRAFT_1471805 [Mycena polygramma]|nr:hypothetical protein DFH06DRAFT_1471805 [Mycena polygramma]
MAHITTALLGSFSRLFFPSPASAHAQGISHSKSEADVALVQQVETHLHPASSTSVRPRPASAMAIEGYLGWGWDAGVEGTTLRRRTRTERDVGLKAPADVKITDSSPVLACQPPRPTHTVPFFTSGAPADAAAALTNIVNTLAPERQNTTPPAPAFTYGTFDPDADSCCDLSLSLSQLDISFVSDTSADELEGDISYTFPPPLPAPALLSTYGVLVCRADFRPDSFFDVSLDASLDISLTSDDSSDGDSSLSFTLPPPPTPRAPASALKHRADHDSSFGLSLDISLISDTSSDGDNSFTFNPPSASRHTTSGAPLKPIGLGITNLYKPSGTPFDGMGVLSFGVCGSLSSPSSPSRASPPPTSRTTSPSPSSSHRHSSPRRHHSKRDTGLSRTFLEEAVWTWAADPQHRHLSAIDEEWDEGEGVRVWTGEDAEYVDICGHTSSSSRTRNRGLGVDRDTISSGLKRTRRSQAASVNGISASGVRRGVWRV